MNITTKSYNFFFLNEHCNQMKTHVEKVNVLNSPHSHMHTVV